MHKHLLHSSAAPTREAQQSQFRSALHLAGDALHLLDRHLGGISADFEQLVIIGMRASVQGCSEAASATGVAQMTFCLL